MSEFGDFSSSSNDPTADFLARERAVLGGDADIFTTLDNTTSPSSIPSYTSPSSISAGTPDLLGTTSNNYTTTVTFSPQYSNSLATTTIASNGQQGDYSVFESNYPKAENLESSQAFYKAQLPDEENSVVRQWRQKHKETIAMRDEDEANRKQEVLNRAREEIDQFYEEYNDKKQKAIEENREREQGNLKNREVPSSANIWTSVIREINVTNTKASYPTRDVSRMKSIMLDLKKDTNAPGTIINH